MANADDYQMQATAKTSHYAGDGYSFDYLEGTFNASASKWENSDPKYGFGAQYFINPKFSLGL